VVIACDYGSYGTNGWTGNPPSPDEVGANYTPWGEPAWFWRRADVKGASRVPLFGDDQWLSGWAYEAAEPPLFQNQPWNAGSGIVRLCPNRHEGHVNWLFLDFSVHRIGLKQLWTLKWHRKYDQEGPWTRRGGCRPEMWPEWMRGFKEY
jgi:prepilin-type processing-associated H-X9-DG protein